MKTRRTNFRRDFLKLAGIGMTAATVSSLTSTNVLARASNPSQNNLFDVRKFGAKGDGTTIDTAAINNAILAAAAAGGGTVLFPAGTYASYSIHLKSFVTLYLDSG